tara:strand:+ start:1029 stop:1217 length:189 start_codon:yes stop_codon:yes gene_type:complete
MEQRVFNEKEAAYYIRMSTSFLAQNRMNKELPNRISGPRFIKIGRAVRYLKEDLDEWISRFK